MSRSALVVAGVLFALGALIWLLTTDRVVPVEPGPGPSVSSGTAAPDATAPQPAAAPSGPPVPTGALDGPLPRVATRAELLQTLNARGLNGEKLLSRYAEWRVARGFLGADPLTGTTPENAPAQVYAAMDRPTLKAMADSGDLGAIQAYAAGSLPGDVFTAVEYYGRASELGSAAAMGAVANVLADIGGLEMGDVMNDRPFADKLLALRGGDPDRDLRRDSVAWTLASIRQYGPILATPASMELVEGLGRSTDKELLTSICGQSLAILASLSAATAGRDSGALPPVFVTERNLYSRLPCQDTPAPVTQPRALAACTSTPAIGPFNQPVELWICPEN